ncbi:MAG TPA: rod shape-determining protein MreC [Euzebyales bacterium]|nr:rod shape-determining protein MreC [Euzebyales bacterium]
MTLVVLTLIALTVMTLDLRDHGAGPVTRLRLGAVAVFAPVQHAAAAVVRPIASATHWVGDQRRLHGELARARAAARRLDAAEAEAEDLRQENATLRRLLAMRDRAQLRTVGARVLGTVPGDPGSTVLIDAGARDGLAAGMTVLDDRGLVGRLIAVGDRHARVELITSPRARYAVRVVAGRHPGRLQGRGDGGLRLELNDLHADVPGGAVVVTRAFEGSTVPDGLLVGTIVDGPVTDRFLAVEPGADPNTLDLVQVVVAGPRAAVVAPGDGASAAPLPPPPQPEER